MQMVWFELTIFTHMLFITHYNVRLLIIPVFILEDSLFSLLQTHYTHLFFLWFNIAVDNSIKLIGAGAFAFHPTLEWIFVGDRRGTLLAWDVSTERPSMIGMLVVLQLFCFLVCLTGYTNMFWHAFHLSFYPNFCCLVFLIEIVNGETTDSPFTNMYRNYC